MADFLQPIKSAISLQNIQSEVTESVSDAAPQGSAGISAEPDTIVPFRDGVEDVLFALSLINMAKTPLHQKVNQQISLAVTNLLQKTITTGAGDDKVDIRMGDDQRVHVNVNGKEAWAGTVKEFTLIKIDTGEGDDVITNTVAGSNIFTGSGWDTVNNQASGVEINTGDGNDIVNSRGNSNWINTGGGDDQVQTRGEKNDIFTGTGNDNVVNEGDHNRIRTFTGADNIVSSGLGNSIDGSAGNDQIKVVGDFNTVSGGGDYDNLEVQGDYNTIDAGYSKVNLKVGGNHNVFINVSPDLVDAVGKLVGEELDYDPLAGLK